jgi:hypothetical protein
MKMKFPILFLTSLASTAVQAVKLSTIFQYPNGTWLENIAPMHNGSLLVTVIGRAEVHMIDPTLTPATSSLLHTFNGHNAVLGITELERNRFAVAVGNVTASNTPIAGTWSVYTLDFNPSSCSNSGDAKKKTEAGIRTEKITDLEHVSMINGITTLNAHTVFLADSWKGNIVSLNLRTGNYSVVLEHPTLKPDFSNTVLPLGVNGIRWNKDWLYYTNTVQNLLGRVKVSRQTGKVKGEWEVVKQGGDISQPDDFAVAKDGSVYLARPLGDTVQHVGLNGSVEEVARGGLASGATSVVFAKGQGEKVLYLSESGLEGGVARNGGRVVRVEL